MISISSSHTLKNLPSSANQPTNKPSNKWDWSRLTKFTTFLLDGGDTELWGGYGGWVEGRGVGLRKKQASLQHDLHSLLRCLPYLKKKQWPKSDLLFRFEGTAQAEIWKWKCRMGVEQAATVHDLNSLLCCLSYLERNLTPTTLKQIRSEDSKETFTEMFHWKRVLTQVWPSR